MPDITNDLVRLLKEGPRSILERTLVAEYLLCQGYLVCDLPALPLHIRKGLLLEACQFAAHKMAQMDAISKYHFEMRLVISQN
jgi:hypothetical protein